MVFNENTNDDSNLLNKQGRTQLVYSTELTTEHVSENFGEGCPVALPIIAVSAGKTCQHHSETTMGAIWWGTRETCPRHFFRWGYIICHVPPLFSLSVCIWRGFKTKCDLCNVLCEEFFILDLTHSYVDVETEFGVVSLILMVSVQNRPVQNRPFITDHSKQTTFITDPFITDFVRT